MTPPPVPDAHPQSADIESLLAELVTGIDQSRCDLDTAAKAMPDDAPLFAVVDLVVAIGHLRQAARRVERAGRAVQLAKAGVR